jgi:hypothetical protein
MSEDNKNDLTAFICVIPFVLAFYDFIRCLDCGFEGGCLNGLVEK